MQPEDSSETVVVTKAVRLVAPFIAVFGLFTMFHGTSGVGGGFQGGVIVAAAVITVGFGFGIDQTRAWLTPARPFRVGLVGVLGLLLLATAPMLYGRSVLEFTGFPGPKGAFYAVEALEVGIGFVVAATLVHLFFAMAPEGGEP